VLLVLGISAAVVVGIAFVCVLAVTLLGTPVDQQSTFVPVDEGPAPGPGRGQEVGGDGQIPWPTLDALSVGDCFVAEIGGDEPDTADDVVPTSCDQPHRSEVFVQEAIEGVEFPGREAVVATVEDLCYGRGFTDYVGRPYDDSMLWQTAFFPTEATWNVGSRMITCFVHGPDPTAPTVGSFRDADV
jgi:hypothetical protein